MTPFIFENDVEQLWSIATSELSAFHTSLRSSGEPAYATYLLSGDVHPDSVIKTHRPQATENGMDIDEEADGSDSEPDIAEGDVVPVTKITLVGEKDLEGEFSAVSIYGNSLTTITSRKICISPYIFGAYILPFSVSYYRMYSSSTAQ